MKRPLYLDNNATTPVDPRVIEVMQDFFSQKFGNPSSASHFYGWEAEEYVNLSREKILEKLGLNPEGDLIFTSGATESNNLLLQGFAKKSKEKIHIISQNTEHKCILESLKEIQKQGHEVTILKVDKNGFVSIKELEKAVQKNTRLVSIMAANNEIGTLQEIEKISQHCQENKIYFHSDAVQAIGKVKLKFDNCDFLSLSAHKIYGPKGIGALYCKPLLKNKLSPLILGGGQEEGLRSGTLNLPGVIGLAKAIEIAIDQLETESKRLSVLRDQLFDTIRKKIPSLILNGSIDKRLPGNLNLSFPGIKSEDLIAACPEIAISSGSACASGSTEPSYVIAALTQNENRIKSTIRLGLGRFTKEEDVVKAAAVLIKAYKKLSLN